MAEYNKYTTFEPGLAHSLHFVSFHAYGPFENTGAKNRADFYGINVYPSNLYDGGNQSDYFFNEAKLNASGTRPVHRLRMSLSKSISGSTLWFKGKVENLESHYFNGIVLVFITESQLIDPNYPTVTWNFVFRDYGLNKMLSLAGSSSTSFNGTWSIPAGVKASNIQVVAAAYDSSTTDPFGRPYAVQSVCDICGRADDDVGVIKITLGKAVVGQNYTMNVDCQLANWGAHSETFNAIAYANASAVQTKAISLGSGISSMVTFKWNSTGFAYGNYMVSVYIPPVSGEADTADNTLSDGMVVVSHVGDINGDGKVDIQDVARVSAAFGSMRVADPQDPRYNQYWHPAPCRTCPHTPNADVTNDGKVDIEDLARTSRYFGWHR